MAVNTLPPAETSEFPLLYRTKTAGSKLAKLADVYHLDVNSEFNGEDQPIRVSGKTAIQQKLSNLFSVLPGEEPFEPQWGSRLQRLLFEPVNPSTASDIEFATISAANSFMRDTIQVLHGMSSVTVSADGEGYDVILMYTDLQTRKVDRFKYRLLPMSTTPTE